MVLVVNDAIRDALFCVADNLKIEAIVHVLLMKL